ncbi:uncharacterized protein LOC122052379 isoform X2 [Zingiber officinale]|uniref:uncharacterized protein LOC122052379 isoform X2 n=1 Tax=Zingiber officinale TaxID=94328 RepID=UPI001C4BFE89|nr:uncharacterized protein LOC122052379 isoform X2 [Zingiber officinale]
MDAGADEAPLVQVEDESGEKDLDAALRCLEGFLALLGFPDSSSRVRLAASWAAFLLLGVAVPSAAIGLYQCSHSVCAEYKVHQFELCVLLSQVLLAAVSLACISRNLLKYGIRRFLFVDQHHGHVERFQKEYVRKIQVSSVVQVVVVVLCLNAASKISHRAQGISSLASRWHAYATCCPIGSQMRTANGSGNIEAVSASSFLRDYSESDLESLENVATYNNAQLTSFTSYHKRQALVIYLQSNPGGITIFGWTVDRTLLNTIFFLELTLVLFVLGKTIVFPSL